MTDAPYPRRNESPATNAIIRSFLLRGLGVWAGIVGLLASVVYMLIN